MRFWILFLLGALITYGSLYPFHFALPHSHASAWAKLFLDWSMLTSRGDALGNIVLFVPLGFAGAFASPAQPHAHPRLLTLALNSLALATVLQVAQIYFPPRTPAMIDVAFNMIGAAIGIATGLLLRTQIRLHWQTWKPAHAVPLGLIVLWIAAELLPLVPSLDLQAIKGSIKALLRLHLSPSNILWHAVGVMLAGCALAAIVGTPRALRLLAALVAIVIVGKVLVVTRVLNASTLIGLAAGYGLWCLVSRWRESGRREAFVLAALLIAYTLKGLEPFELQVDPRPFNWIPFAGMLKGSMLFNAKVLIESVFFFAAMLGLVRMQGARVGACSVVLALWVGAIEAIQMYIVGRTPGITEPLLVLLIGQILRHAPSGTPNATPLHAADRRNRSRRRSGSSGGARSRSQWRNGRP